MVEVNAFYLLLCSIQGQTRGRGYAESVSGRPFEGAG